jgi:hypothetical protein
VIAGTLDLHRKPDHLREQHRCQKNQIAVPGYYIFH